MKFDLTIEERVGNRRLFSHSKNVCRCRGGPKRLKCLRADVGVCVEELMTKKFRGYGKTNGWLFNGKTIFIWMPLILKGLQNAKFRHSKYSLLQGFI